jgi:hypothetical protein
VVSSGIEQNGVTMENWKDERMEYWNYANMTNHQIPEVLPAAWAKTQQQKQRAIVGVIA